MIRWTGIVSLGALMAIGGLQYSLWFSSRGVVEMRQLDRQLTQLEALHDQFSSENQQLMQEIDRLQHDPDTLAMQARRLGMIQEGQIYYRLLKSK